MFLMKKARNGAFVRDGVAIEMVLDREDKYQDIIDKGCEILDEIEVGSAEQLTLLSSGGAVIPRKPDWTLGSYMRQMHKGPTQTRIGIEVIKKVSISGPFLLLCN